MNRNRNPDLAENSAGTRVTTENTTGNGVAPQITSTIGVPEPVPEVVEATGAAGAVTILNPNTPVNRLSEGGIVFAYPDLVYSQFIDTDQQIEVTDDTAPGAVILQIPYHPISDYTNQYIQSYARMHERYNGDIIFRAQIIGNTTFSGTLMWFWWPRKYPTAIVSMADAMKYAYKSQSIQFNSVEELILHDARQYLYYRDMNEFDIESRPHLVLMVHTTLQSPLREGIKIRIRIGSRLASASAADRMKMTMPFIFANPLPIPSSVDPGAGNINGKSMVDVFPHLSVKTYRMFIDGNTTASYQLFDETGHGRNWNSEANINGLTGYFDQGTPTKLYLYTVTPPADNVSYIVYSVHQFKPSLVSAIVSEPTFSLLTNENVLQQCADLVFVKPHVSVYASRNLATNLVINTGVVLAQQTTAYTSAGKLTLVVVKLLRDQIKDFSNIGFPNIAGGIPMRTPTSDILGPTNFSNGLIKLPSNWVSLKFTDEQPSIVNANTDIAPSLFSDVTLLKAFEKLTAGLVEDQVLQFDLVDKVARIRIATVRFIPGRKEFVLNPIDANKYKAYAGDLADLLFANYGVQPAAASFPVTDTTAWLSRLPSSILTTFRAFKLNAFNNHPNAFVGAVLEDLAGGIDAASSLLEGSKPLMTMNNGLEDPIQTQEWLAPTSPTMTTLRPQMNVNIPLMSKLQQPTWTTTRTDFGQTDQGFENGEPVRDAEDEATPLLPSQEISPNAQDAKNGLQMSFRAMKAMSLAELTHLVTHQLWQPNGNVAGGLAESGMNWGHDVDLQHRIAQSQAEAQQRQNDWQGQQNQNSYQNQQRMQGIDIASRQSMQQASFQHENQMQQANFGQQNYSQGNLFSHENQMQQSGFSQQTAMSNLDFAHSMAQGAQTILGGLANTATGGLLGVAGNLVSSGMNLWGQSKQQDFQREMNSTMYKQDLTLQHNSILGNIANTATGGVFGAISQLGSTAINAGVGYLEQGRDQEFQQKMQTNNFNNAIYASGNSAAAMKIATPS